MTRRWVSLLGGLMFGGGLAISGVANPVVINNFLDLASPNLDFTLIILFGVALVVSTIAYQLVLRTKTRPVYAAAFDLPTRTTVDARLVIGSLIFGFGWALSGHCAGPALASLAGMYDIALPYLVASAVGCLAFRVVERMRSPGQ